MAQRRTNQGQMLDMDALMLQGEKEIALGNMKGSNGIQEMSP